MGYKPVEAQWLEQDDDLEKPSCFGNYIEAWHRKGCARDPVCKFEQRCFAVKGE